MCASCSASSATTGWQSEYNGVSSGARQLLHKTPIAFSKHFLWNSSEDFCFSCQGWSSMCSSFFPPYANPYILEISINNSFLKRKHGKSVLLNSATFSNIKLMLTPQCLYNAVIESTNGEMQLSKESRAGTLVQLCLHLQLYRSFSKKHQQNILCRLITNIENKCILFLSKVEYTLANERITEIIERSSSPIPLQMSKGKNQDHKK